jgi:hypothetical protein
MHQALPMTKVSSKPMAAAIVRGITLSTSSKGPAFVHAPFDAGSFRVAELDYAATAHCAGAELPHDCLGELVQIDGFEHA